MAVAVKNSADVGAAGLLDRIPVVSLAGAAYVLGSLGIVFGLLPALWWRTLGLSPTSFAAASLLGVVMLAAAGGLAVLGGRLLGPRAIPGARAGIFTTLAGLLLTLLLTLWAGLWLEHWAFDLGWFTPATGAALTAAVGLALLALGAWALFRRGTERAMVQFEAQGWFHANAYKRLQGQRVRRATIVGLLAVVAAGIWTLVTHGTLGRGSPDWQLNIPFTGQVIVASAGDAAGELNAFRQPDGRLVVDRYDFQRISARYDRATHLKVLTHGTSSFQDGDVVPKATFEAERRKIAEDAAGVEPTAGPPEPPSGTAVFRTVTLLPAVKFTVPLLLLAGAIWLAWRVVNMPTFADFLIATEAELNKVSWSTRPRLVQDTIVVLATVALMAAFLFGTDQFWRFILSVKPVEVLQFPKNTGQSQDRDRPVW